MKLDMQTAASANSESETNAPVTVFAAQDTINSIDINDAGTNIAIADDSGRIHVLDASTYQPLRKFRSVHENIATCVKFRSKRTWEVWSAGMDYTVIQWDFSKGSILQQYRYGIHAYSIFFFTLSSIRYKLTFKMTYRYAGSTQSQQ
eukprot:jgi/Hompol1/6013/HPOL_001464-RA